MSDNVTVYFDYLCPFAWRGAEVADIVTEALDIRFEWRHFSLYQSNYDGNGHWQLWNEPVDPDDEDGTKGLLPFLASCAARCQGEEAYQAFRLTAMRSRYERHQPYTLSSVRAVAEEAGLHLPRFEQDLANPEFRTLLAKEHHEAVALNVFGTPTFQFANGDCAYFRIADLPKDASEAVELFRQYRHMLYTFPYLETIKRPREKRN